MLNIRRYKKEDELVLNNIAVMAFEQYSEQFANWAAFSEQVRAGFSSISNQAKIIVATKGDEIIGGVAYVPGYIEKPDYFPINTPTIRMLVVHPNFRGLGVGKKLTLECIKLANLEKSNAIGLHTSSIMEVALPMYLRMGFTKTQDAPEINNVKYSVYIKDLTQLLN